MNIIYHAAVGVAGEVVFKNSGGLFLLGSIYADTALIFNEIRIRWNGVKFNPNAVDRFTLSAYRANHSCLILIPLFYINKFIFFGYLIHLLCDWFTHTGVFATMPLYPLSKYQIKFGKEMLK